MFHLIRKDAVRLLVQQRGDAGSERWTPIEPLSDFSLSGARAGQFFCRNDARATSWRIGPPAGARAGKTGDGFLAAFDGPGRAINCAQAIAGFP
jgi:hypothetical protein